MSSIKETLIKIYAKHVVRKTAKWSSNPVKTQVKVMKKLVSKAKKTKFGKDHSFQKITTYDDFSREIPISDYEGIRPYIEKVIEGNKNILWPGKPIYFAKTSGTTSGEKYIPITKDSIPFHVKGSVDATMHYILETNNTAFLNKKIIFLQGSPVLKKLNGIKTGRLSGIIAHYTPVFLRKNTMPSWETNCIEDWEKKIEKVSKETLKEEMAAIGGIPPWVVMYFEKLISLSGKQTITEIFPDFSLFVYGGVNFGPYKNVFKKLIGKNIDSIEYYPASEAFFAYQDSQRCEGLLIQLNSGIFYEFIETSEMINSNPKRISIKNVELDKNYVLIISTNAGLWGYNTGDTVAFVSLSPYRIIVTGRYKHFISAFGEHVIGSEVESALKKATNDTKIVVKEFTVAPLINPEKSLPFHQWWIEFVGTVSLKEMAVLQKKIDENLKVTNSYYSDLIKGKVLKPLEIVVVKENGFKKYMEMEGKLGGQNKLPRLSNDRLIVEKMMPFKK